MFGLGKVPCAVCTTCRASWEHAGALCARCKMRVRGAHDVGVLLDRYAFGHADCGAVQLAV